MKNLLKNMISNAYVKDGSEVSASGFIGSLIVIISLLLMFILTISFLFLRQEAKIFYDLIEIYMTVLIVGSSLLGLRRLSSLLPTNKFAQRIDSHREDNVSTETDKTEEVLY